MCLPEFSPFLLQEEVKDLCPVPVTLSCTNEMGKIVSMADFLVSKGLALRDRKPRSVIYKGATNFEYQIKVQLLTVPLPVLHTSFICRDAADEKAKEVSSRSAVMEAQADTRSFGSALAKVPLPSQISVPSTRAHPKLVPRTVVSEKVKLHHFG